jgi:hypothetical protein
VPFLRLSRDRRGFEHTFLLHADVPGKTPRVLYWYRTAPGVLIGRPALDEEAIRSIEEQHPHIEFDWPAILALRDAMPPEEDSEPARQPRGRRPTRREPLASRQPVARPEVPEPVSGALEETALPAPAREEHAPTTHGLLEELVGRDIATRLRARYAEIMARIHERGLDEAMLARWVARAEPLDPDTWLTADAVLDGVREADERFEALRTELLGR